MNHQWYNDLYNRWTNNMNLIADKDIFPELIGGQCWFGKIANTLADWYLNPSIRFDFI
jgi:lipid A disaccharide synthetase